MARKYVLGPNAARKIAELIRGSGEVSRRPGATAALAFDSEYVAPFTVQWAQSAVGGDGSWIIWLPGADLVVTKDETIDPTSELSDVGGDYPDGWYVLDDSMLSGANGGTLYLILDFGEEPSATFGAEAADEYDGKFSIPICEAFVDSGTGERKVRQFVTSAIVLAGGEEPDEVSVDGSGGDSEDKLQIAHFNDAEKDSGKGLANRLKADTKTGEISSDDKDVMLIARKNGEVIYIPLSGNGEDPPSDVPSASGDPCDHDPGGGSVGGVMPDDDGGHGGGASVVGGGGVIAGGGEPHAGDDNCNCE